MSRPIRILELRSVWGSGGGPEKTILLSAARHDRRRYQVTVCYIRDARDQAFRIGQRARDMGLDYAEVVERHSFDPGVWPALRELVREREIDVVHAHEYKTDLLALLLGRAEDVVPLATAHNWSGVRLKERIYYFFDRRLLPYYPRIITVTDELRRDVIRAGADPSRVTYIPNGIDPVWFRRTPGSRLALRGELGIPAEAIVLGSLGRLALEKRYDLLLEAAAALEGSPWVVIAGDGPERDAIAGRAAALGIEDRVRLVGQRDDVREVHQIFDVYVQTSDREGMPNVLLEAMALETPVVATDVGGTRDLVEGGVHGVIVPPGDAKALAGAIARTLADRTATRHRVAAARRRIEDEFSFDRRLARIESIYEELAALKRRRRAAR